MSILKYILKPFVDFKEDQVQAPGDAQENRKDVNIDNTPVAGGNNTTGTSSPSSYIDTSINVSTQTTGNESYRKHFEELMEEANAKNPVFQGTDFKEFVESKVDVEAIADEETRYKTAFSVLKRTGLTKEKLISTGQEYIKIINADLKGFVDAFEQEYQKNVEQKEVLVQKKAAELKSLNEKIAALNAEITKMSEEIVTSKSKLNSNKISFVEAGQNMIKDIHAELQKIDRYF